MMALEKGVCSDEMVNVAQPYLARIGERYLAITPFDITGENRTLLPYKEAYFVDPVTREQKSFLTLHELAPII